MGEFSYAGGEGEGSAINESLQHLLVGLQSLEQNRPQPLETQRLKNELDEMAHRLEEIKNQMKEMRELPPKTQQLLQQIRTLIHYYNSRIVQYGYESLLSATKTLQTTPL